VRNPIFSKNRISLSITESGAIMLIHQLEQLQERFPKLNEGNKKHLEEVLDILLELMNISPTAEKDSLGEIRNYLRRKLNSERDIEDFDILKIRKYVVHKKNKKFMQKYHLEITQVMWDILPELSEFININELDSYLAYFFRIKLGKEENFTDKKAVISRYKELYGKLETDKKNKLFQDLAYSIFAIATRTDMCKLKAKVTNKSTRQSSPNYA
jgi:hypothetical protein